MTYYCLSDLNEVTHRSLSNLIPTYTDEESLDIVESHIYQFKKIFKQAYIKYKIYKKLISDYLFERFVRFCSKYKYRNSEIINIEYYTGNGGYIKNSQFLFGTASQFRDG